MAGRRGGAPASESLPPPVAATLSTRPQQSPVTTVLNDDDLLREILFRLAFPISIIHAALVCKRWLGITSDLAFLRRFRKLHPPLLGFYLKCWGLPFMKFVAMPRTNELSAILCRAHSVFDRYSNTNMWGLHFHSRNGRLLAKFHGPDSAIGVVLSPLNLQSNTVTLPPLPFLGQEVGMTIYPLGYLLNDQACFSAVLVFGQELTIVHLFELIDGVWQNHTLSAIEDCPVSCAGIKTLLTNHRLYIISSKDKILVLDFMSLVLSVIKLPEEVECKHNLRLSQADDAGFNLVHVKELELCVWLYTHGTDNSGLGGYWLLVHTICLREVSTNFRMSNLVPENRQSSIVKLHAVGDNAEFVVLEICRAVVYLDITSRAAEKLYTLAPDDGDIFRIHPFMMTWPPTFPCNQRKTGPKGVMQPESQGDASPSRSVFEMAGSKRMRTG